MSLPKLSAVVVVVVLVVVLAANLLMVAVSGVDPSEPAPDTSDGAGAPQRTGHLHLEGRGSDKVTLAVQGGACIVHDDLHGPTPPARTSCDDDDRASLPGGHMRLELKRLRVGEGSAVDELVKLARAAATEMDVSMIMGNPDMEPGDVWKIMSCAVLISEQNGGTWDSKEAVQLRSMGFFSREDVLKQLGVIARPSDCSEPITYGSREEL